MTWKTTRSPKYNTCTILHHYHVQQHHHQNDSTKYCRLSLGLASQVLKSQIWMWLVLKCLSISCANSSRHQFWGSNQVLRSDVQLLWSSSFMFVNSNFVCIIKFQTNCWQAAMKTCFLPLLLLLGLLVAALLFRSIVNTLLLTMDLKMTVASQTRWASISLCWGGGWSPFHSSYLEVQRMPKFMERISFHTPKQLTTLPSCGAPNLKAR